MSHQNNNWGSNNWNDNSIQPPATPTSQWETPQPQNNTDYIEREIAINNAIKNNNSWENFN
jgi:hypothetical protein